jgi:caa(3)-type oxidase subunit IV
MQEAESTHPNYRVIWISLLALLGLSVLLGRIHNPVAMNVLVFGVATAKALLVVRYFMHLTAEPLWVAVFLITAVFCLAALFIGITPDITWRSGWDF